MKHIVIGLLVLIGGGFIRADEKEVEAQAKALLETATKLVEMMKGVKDRASAEKAKPDLEKTVASFIKSQEGFRKLPREEVQKLEATYSPKFDALQVQFRKESERLQKIEGVMDILGDLAPFKAAREARIRQAGLMVQNLDRALQIYKLTNGEYPTSLEELAKGDKPVVEKNNLKDPWGRAFMYDVTGPKNKGNKPDVWSLGPPEKKDALVGNWNTKPPVAPRDK